jgi:hypothetical protein
MERLPLALAILALAGCTHHPVEATGVYRLTTAEKSMVLDLRPNGDYVLQVDGPGRNTDEIRGRWEDERGAGPHVSLQGLRWRGSEPEPGPGIWTTTFRRNAEICLDVDSEACFSRDDAA